MNTPSESGPPPRGEYLYAIAALGKDRAYDVPGIDGAAVFSVHQGPVAAVVSLCARQKLRPERAYLAAHKGVLHRLMLDGTILPMAFGTIADDVNAVRRLLAFNQDVIRSSSNASPARSRWVCASNGTCPTSSSILLTFTPNCASCATVCSATSANRARRTKSSSGNSSISHPQRRPRGPF